MISQLRGARLLFGLEALIKDGRFSERIHILDVFEVRPVLAILERSARIIPFQVLNVPGNYDTINI